MACSFGEIGEYAVAPILMSPYSHDPCCLGTTSCMPYLSLCEKKKEECHEIRPERKSPKPSRPTYNCCSECSERPRSPAHSKCPSSQKYEEYCPTCKNSCNPVKTKYVIPCYRYEDGRIVSFEFLF